MGAYPRRCCATSQPSCYFITETLSGSTSSRLAISRWTMPITRTLRQTSYPSPAGYGHWVLSADGILRQLSGTAMTDTPIACSGGQRLTEQLPLRIRNGSAESLSWGRLDGSRCVWGTEPLPPADLVRLAPAAFAMPMGPALAGSGQWAQREPSSLVAGKDAAGSERPDPVSVVQQAYGWAGMWPAPLGPAGSCAWLAESSTSIGHKHILHPDPPANGTVEQSEGPDTCYLRYLAWPDGQPSLQQISLPALPESLGITDAASWHRRRSNLHVSAFIDISWDALMEHTCVELAHWHHHRTACAAGVPIGLLQAHYRRLDMAQAWQYNPATFLFYRTAYSWDRRQAIQYLFVVPDLATGRQLQVVKAKLADTGHGAEGVQSWVPTAYTPPADSPMQSGYGSGEPDADAIGWDTSAVSQLMAPLSVNTLDADDWLATDDLWRVWRWQGSGWTMYDTAITTLPDARFGLVQVTPGWWVGVDTWQSGGATYGRLKEFFFGVGTDVRQRELSPQAPTILLEEAEAYTTGGGYRTYTSRRLGQLVFSIQPGGRPVILVTWIWDRSNLAGTSWQVYRYQTVAYCHTSQGWAQVPVADVSQAANSFVRPGYVVT